MLNLCFMHTFIYQDVFQNWITEFVFDEYPQEGNFFKEDCLQGEKGRFIYASAEYYLWPNTVG